ncbi:hypothetical protein TUM18999_09140 [Pseudomonas tohonis]|uniref:DUF2790 domain-containing protein n=1 Tax=Pseudomonas tohonis TaxID=2725477 RepID=A0A6J4DYP3_9PSED|nr:DUF2790 domain-containing protein [Pseudomonas tohonis]BCG22723.1 hypothetical protein TUM18999_09140 [Pseudomonas tohonis]GJN54989.1 hypothetical protein TUM20286_47410 [Pseudomonas tohonis]
MKALACGATALLFVTLASAAHAEGAARAEPFVYGMHLDVAQVVSIDEPHPLTCELVEAKMTYVDSQGQTRAVSYIKQSDACSNS